MVVSRATPLKGVIATVDRCDTGRAVLVEEVPRRPTVFGLVASSLPEPCLEGQRVHLAVREGWGRKSLPSHGRKSRIEAWSSSGTSVRCRAGQRTLSLPRSLFPSSMRRGSRWYLVIQERAQAVAEAAVVGRRQQLLLREPEALELDLSEEVRELAADPGGLRKEEPIVEVLPGPDPVAVRRELE